MMRSKDSVSGHQYARSVMCAWIFAGMAFLPGLAVAADAQAAVFDALTDRWYEIEMIVFERTSGTDLQHREALVESTPPVLPIYIGSHMANADNWGRGVEVDPTTRACMRTFRGEIASGSDDPTPAPTYNADGTTAPPHPADVFRDALQDFETSLWQRALALRPEGAWQLQQADERLRRSGQNRVLYHQRWLQALPERDAPLALPVSGGLPVGERRELEGTVAVTLGRYIHADVNLRLYGVNLNVQPIPALQDAQAMLAVVRPPVFGTYYHLSEQRRMRSAELHYLDHPELGVLIRVDPVEIPASLTAQYAAMQDTAKR